MQVRRRDAARVARRFAAAGARGARPSARPTAGERVRIRHGGARPARRVARRAASRVVGHHPRAAATARRPGLRRRGVRAARRSRRSRARAALTFDPDDDVAAPFVATGARPRVAILREQGVNGQVEMAAAFDRAGFDACRRAHERPVAGRRSLADFAGFVACGGFSYGDVLGAGEGWAKSILFNARARDDFAAFFARGDTFALGVCNGCQMMSNLRELVPGAGALAALRPQPLRAVRGAPRAARGRSRARRSSSPAWPAAASRSPSRTARAGRVPRRGAARGRAQPLVALRFVDHRGAPTERYPYNPNGSPRGITGPDDGRRPRHDPDAAPRARVPHRAAVLAAGRTGARTRRGCGCSATRGRGWGRC